MIKKVKDTNSIITWTGLRDIDPKIFYVLPMGASPKCDIFRWSLCLVLAWYVPVYLKDFFLYTWYDPEILNTKFTLMTICFQDCFHVFFNNESVTIQIKNKKWKSYFYKFLLNQPWYFSIIINITKLVP